MPDVAPQTYVYHSGCLVDDALYLHHSCCLPDVYHKSVEILGAMDHHSLPRVDSGFRSGFRLAVTLRGHRGVDVAHAGARSTARLRRTRPGAPSDIWDVRHMAYTADATRGSWHRY